MLLVHPHVRIDPYTISKADAPVTPSLTLAALAGVVRRSGASATVCDLYGRPDPLGFFRQALKEYRPDLIAFTFHTPQADQAAALAALARQEDPSVEIVGGGVHATALPEETLRQSVYDALVLGEGEVPFEKILAGEDLSSIPGVACQEDGRIHTNLLPPLISDLDDLPMPDYEVFDLPRYRVRKRLWKNAAIASIETSRGCPYNCSFCVSNLVFGNKFRSKSPERVREEFERLHRLGFREVLIQDDDFTVDQERAVGIFESLIASGLKMDFELSNGVRTERLTRDFLKTARRAGCYRLRIGIESGSPEVLKKVEKNLDLERLPKVIADAHAIGLEVIALFILGLPGETTETFRETLRFASTCGADMARLALFTPYPGSMIYEEWLAEGRLLPASHSDYLMHQLEKPLYRHPTMSHPELVQCYHAFYRNFYLRPGYILRQGVRWLRRGSLADYTLYFLEKFLKK